MKKLQRKGWWSTLANKKNRIYAFVLILATILFIIGMVKCIFSIQFTGDLGRITKISKRSSKEINERLEYLDSYVEKNGPDVLYNELFFGHDYEPEFDYYWEFADIQVTGVRGRFADDNTKYRRILEDYIANCDDEIRADTARGYLELME